MSRGVIDLLVSRGAPAIDHPGGDLLTHLVRTSESLRSWGAPPELVVAGLTHAAYGTDGFDVALFSLTERGIVAAAIGARAEAIVYRYASCDRAFAYPQIGRRTGVAFRDRFTMTVEHVPHDDVRAFAELTLANELDLVRHSESFRRTYGPALRSLFARWKCVVHESAYEDYERLLGDGPDRAG